MAKLLVFNNISLDGFFTDANSDMSFAHNDVPDPEWDAFVQGNAAGGGTLLFGRKTYEMMAGFWTSPLAKKNMPVVAEQMNRHSKVVFSKTLEKASWNNTRLVKTGMIAEVRNMKKEPGPGLAILGSGSIVAQLAQEGLIDEYQFVVNPVVIGRGRTMFEGVKEKISLKLTKTRAFRNGNVFLCHEQIN
ncbi:MAG TPA: dihydrofolate reductase family protein [Chitinivibrionales bacterium]|nr:dihydrofolate reductase family protein [Chitinivibrionales bacterium]